MHKPKLRKQATGWVKAHCYEEEKSKPFYFDHLQIIHIC